MTRHFNALAIGQLLTAALAGLSMARAEYYARRFRRALDALEAAVDGGCHQKQAHDWLNWSPPVAMAIKVPAGIMGGEVVERDVMVQTRTCTRCNLQQRAQS